jgi:L-iditol 2-dehydrogenase
VAAPGARVVVIGTNPGDRVAFSSGTARRKGLTLRFVRRSRNTTQRCLKLIDRGLVRAADLVTHTLPFTKAQDAYALVEGRIPGTLKVLIDMQTA